MSAKCYSSQKISLKTGVKCYSARTFRKNLRRAAGNGRPPVLFCLASCPLIAHAVNGFENVPDRLVVFQQCPRNITGDGFFQKNIRLYYNLIWLVIQESSNLSKKSLSSWISELLISLLLYSAVIIFCIELLYSFSRKCLLAPVLYAFSEIIEVFCVLSCNGCKGSCFSVLISFWHYVTRLTRQNCRKIWKRKRKGTGKRPLHYGSETGSDSCRGWADSRRTERNPLTETADRHRKRRRRTACLAVLHIPEDKKVSWETKNLAGDFLSYVFRVTLIISPVLFWYPDYKHVFNHFYIFSLTFAISNHNKQSDKYIAGSWLQRTRWTRL